jgi:hypothetical protein
MDVAGIVDSLEASGLASTIRTSLYLFPLLESAHVTGLTLVFGTILLVDLRLLGLASTSRPFTAVASDVLKWTWLAFAVTATTGALMFVTNATTYYHSAHFRAKMTLLVVSGINMLVFELTARRSVHTWDLSAKAPVAGRAVAVLSLVMWLGVIVLGRWVGFATASTPASVDPGMDLERLEDLLPK